MDKRHQVYFRESIAKDYPNIEKFFDGLSGNDRARAFMAIVEAFIQMTSSQNADARTIYHLAETIRGGFDIGNRVPAEPKETSPVPIKDPEPVIATPAPVVSQTDNDYDDDWAAALNSNLNPPEPKEGGN